MASLGPVIKAQGNYLRVKAFKSAARTLLAMEFFLCFGLVGFGFLTYAAFGALAQSVGPVVAAVWIGALFLAGSGSIYFFWRKRTLTRFA